jgi:hypothetical protein
MVESVPHKYEVFGVSLAWPIKLRATARIVLLVILLAAPARLALADDPPALHIPAPSQPSEPRLPYNPGESDWLRQPDWQDMRQAYPDKAWRRPAHTLADCLIDHAGYLTDCRVIYETPQDLGFAKATLNLAKHFRIRSHVGNGISTAGYWLVVPFNWAPY